MDKKNPMGKEDASRIQAAESKKEGDTGSFASRAQVSWFSLRFIFWVYDFNLNRPPQIKTSAKAKPNRRRIKSYSIY